MCYWGFVVSWCKDLAWESISFCSLSNFLVLQMLMRYWKSTLNTGQRRMTCKYTDSLLFKVNIHQNISFISDFFCCGHACSFSIEYTSIRLLIRPYIRTLFLNKYLLELWNFTCPSVTDLSLLLVLMCSSFVLESGDIINHCDVKRLARKNTLILWYVFHIYVWSWVHFIFYILVMALRF